MFIGTVNYETISNVIFWTHGRRNNSDQADHPAWKNLECDMSSSHNVHVIFRTINFHSSLGLRKYFNFRHFPNLWYVHLYIVICIYIIFYWLISFLCGYMHNVPFYLFLILNSGWQCETAPLQHSHILALGLDSVTHQPVRKIAW